MLMCNNHLSIYLQQIKLSTFTLQFYTIHAQYTLKSYSRSLSTHRINIFHAICTIAITHPHLNVWYISCFDVCLNCSSPPNNHIISFIHIYHSHTDCLDCPHTLLHSHMKRYLVSIHIHDCCSFINFILLLRDYSYSMQHEAILNK